jgi:hypothetical protein
MWIITKPNGNQTYCGNRRDHDIVAAINNEFGECKFHWIPDGQWTDLTTENITYDEEGKADPATCRKWTFDASTGTLTVTDMSDKPKVIATFKAEHVTA